MNKSSKIVVGFIVVILIVLAGFVFFKKPNGSGSVFSPNNPSQNTSGFEHIIRPLIHGGVPGDGGGG